MRLGIAWTSSINNVCESVCVCVTEVGVGLTIVMHDPCTLLLTSSLRTVNSTKIAREQWAIEQFRLHLRAAVEADTIGSEAGKRT